MSSLYVVTSFFLFSEITHNKQKENMYDRNYNLYSTNKIIHVICFSKFSVAFFSLFLFLGHHVLTIFVRAPPMAMSVFLGIMAYHNRIFISGRCVLLSIDDLFSMHEQFQAGCWVIMACTNVCGVVR